MRYGVLLLDDNVVQRDGSGNRAARYRGPVEDPPESTPKPAPERIVSACQLCGTPVPQAPITWMCDRGPRGAVWTCPDCARAHLRSIEAKLDQEYW